MQKHYETLVIFIVCFDLKMLKNIDFYIKTRSTQGVCVFFPEQKCNLVTVLVWLNLALLLNKLCKVHMRWKLQLLQFKNVKKND